MRKIKKTDAQRALDGVWDSVAVAIVKRQATFIRNYCTGDDWSEVRR